MKIKSLYIEKYKNLSPLTIDFKAGNGLTILVGNNGSVVVTSFCQSLQAMSSFMLFSICATYCTLSSFPALKWRLSYHSPEKEKGRTGFCDSVRPSQYTAVQQQFFFVQVR